MKTLLWLGFIILSQGFVVYDEDNRLDTIDASSAAHMRAATSSAALIHQDNIKLNGNVATLVGRPLGEAFHLCSDQRFFKQIGTVATCSGVLVAPDIIATAGHCMESKDRCTRHHWVFDFKIKNKKDASVTVPSDNVYRCKEIIERGLNDNEDFALVRLDRNVTDRLPITVASQEAKVGDKLVLIGHPSGLPQKIADKGVVLNFEGNFFRATLDAFANNSGSGVFDSVSGYLVGLLVEGAPDYRARPNGKCMEVNVLQKNFLGEKVSPIKQFLPYLE